MKGKLSFKDLVEKHIEQTEKLDESIKAIDVEKLQEQIKLNTIDIERYEKEDINLLARMEQINAELKKIEEIGLLYDTGSAKEECETKIQKVEELRAKNHDKIETLKEEKEDSENKIKKFNSRDEEKKKIDEAIIKEADDRTVALNKEISKEKEGLNKKIEELNERIHKYGVGNEGIKQYTKEEKIVIDRIEEEIAKTREEIDNLDKQIEKNEKMLKFFRENLDKHKNKVKIDGTKVVEVNKSEEQVIEEKPKEKTEKKVEDTPIETGFNAKKQTADEKEQTVNKKGEKSKEQVEDSFLKKFSDFQEQIDDEKGQTVNTKGEKSEEQVEDSPIEIKFNAKEQTYTLSKIEGIFRRKDLKVLKLEDVLKKKEFKKFLEDNSDYFDKDAKQGIDPVIAYIISESGLKNSDSMLKEYYEAFVSKDEKIEGLEIRYDMHSIYSRKYSPELSSTIMSYANAHEDKKIAKVDKGRFTEFLEKHDRIRDIWEKVTKIGAKQQLLLPETTKPAQKHKKPGAVLSDEYLDTLDKINTITNPEELKKYAEEIAYTENLSTDERNDLIKAANRRVEVITTTGTTIQEKQTKERDEE